MVAAVGPAHCHGFSQSFSTANPVLQTAETPLLCVCARAQERPQAADPEGPHRRLQLREVRAPPSND